MRKEGWEYKKLGEVCEIRRGLTYSKNDEVDFSSNIVLRSNNVDLDSHKIILDELKYLDDNFEIASDKIINRGELLICMSNGSKSHLGKVALVEDELNYAFGGFMAAISHNEYLNDKFFYYSLITPFFQNYIKKLSDGANINNLKSKDIQQFVIPVPSLREQEEIVAYLDGEFERIEKLKANAEAALQHTKALFQSTLKQLLTPKPNWEEKELEKTCSHIVDCPHTTPVKSITKTIYPCIRTSELKGGEIFWDSMQYVEEDEYKKRVTRLIPQENDIVYGREGTFGDAVLLPKGYNFCLGQRTMLLRANTNMISPCFLLYQIISPFVYNQACEKNVGCGVPHVNVADVKKFKISFPPLAEQQAIVSRLDTFSEHCRKLEQNYRDTLTLCDDLKQALLREVFE